MQKFHDNLPLSKGKFIYGEVEDERVIRQILEKKIQGVVILDNLRYIKNDSISRLNVEFIIIKDKSNNFYWRYKRPNNRMPFEIQLYSPCDYLKIFPEYSVLRIYSSKFLFHVKSQTFCI